MSTLYVLDKTTKKPVHIEEKYTSLVWTERYQETGDFVLTIPLEVADFSFYKRGNYVVLDDGTEPMMIETLDITEDAEDPSVEISGRSVSLILDRRINASKALDIQAGTADYSGTLSEVVQKLVDSEMINPTMQTYYWLHKEPNGDVVEGYSETYVSWKAKKTINAPNRKLSNFSYRNVNASGTIDKKFDKLMSVYDILVSFSKKLKTGFRVVFDGSNFVLETYQGTDRTSGQTINDPILFDKVMDNVTYTNYYEDQSSYKNVGLAYSDGAYSPVEYNASFSSYIFDGYVWVTNDSEKEESAYSGLDRMEVAFDARSSASVASWDPYSYYYPEEEEEADKSIEEKVKAVAESEFDSEDYDFISLTEGEIDPLVRYKFGVDYFLGDTVEITSSSGTVQTALIDEVVRSYDSDGIIITPNFKNMEDYDYGDEGEEDATS